MKIGTKIVLCKYDFGEYIDQHQQTHICWKEFDVIEGIVIEYFDHERSWQASIRTEEGEIFTCVMDKYHGWGEEQHWISNQRLGIWYRRCTGKTRGGLVILREKTL